MLAHPLFSTLFFVVLAPGICYTVSNCIRPYQIDEVEVHKTSVCCARMTT